MVAALCVCIYLCVCVCLCFHVLRTEPPVFVQSKRTIITGMIMGHQEFKQIFKKLCLFLGFLCYKNDQRNSWNADEAQAKRCFVPSLDSLPRVQIASQEEFS